MLNIRILIPLLFLGFACKTSYNIDSLKENQCSDFRYGIVELKRKISDTEKKSLEAKGMFVQDFLFDDVYQGLWYKKWDKAKLAATPIKKLKAFTIEEKLSEGIKLVDIKNDTRSCGLIIQSFSPLDESELKKYGKLLNQNSSYYRLETQYKNIQYIATNPCIKHISIMKPIQEIPDQKN